MFKEKPFGGIHVLFTGDFYQLKPVFGNALYQLPNKNDSQCLKGSEIWRNYMNEYIELTENCRFATTEIPILQTFLSNARKGIVDPDLLLQLNSRVVSVQTAKRKANPKAIWIAPTNEQVNKLNKQDFDDALINGKLVVRCIAIHTPARPMISNPTFEIRKKLFDVYDKNCMCHVDLYIGQQVTVVGNLATEIGKISSS